MVDSFRWDCDHYSLSTDRVQLSVLAPMAKSNGLFVCQKGSNNVFFLELSSTADQRSVLLRQAPAMRATLDISFLATDSASSSGISISSLCSCSKGEIIMVAFERDGKSLPSVGLYVSSREQNQLSITFLRYIRLTHDTIICELIFF